MAGATSEGWLKVDAKGDTTLSPILLSRFRPFRAKYTHLSKLLPPAPITAFMHGLPAPPTGAAAGARNDGAPGPIWTERGLGHPLSRLIHGQGEPCTEPT